MVEHVTTNLTDLNVFIKEKKKKKKAGVSLAS